MTEDKKEFLNSQLDDLLPGLLRWAISRISQKEDAEDLVQEVFLIVYEKFHTFQGKSSFKTWIYSILNHKISEYYKKNLSTRKNTVEVAEIENLVFRENGGWDKKFVPHEWPDDLETENVIQIMKQCMTLLSDMQNSVIQSKYFDEQRSEQICSDLNISKPNYWQLLHRIRLQLRACIERQIQNGNNL